MIRIRDLIKRAVISLVGADDKQLRVQQATAFGQTFDLEVIFPYGVSANLPVGAFLTVLAVNGDEGYRVAIGDDPDNRIKNLAEGEVVFFHPPSGSKIHFKENGTLDIESELNINIISKGIITITGTIVNINP